MANTGSVVNALGKYTTLLGVVSTTVAATSVTFAHGLAAAPDVVTVLPIKGTGSLAQWYVAAKGATNVTLTKGVTTGSSGTGVQCHFLCQILHSTIK